MTAAQRREGAASSFAGYAFSRSTSRRQRQCSARDALPDGSRDFDANAVAGPLFLQFADGHIKLKRDQLANNHLQLKWYWQHFHQRDTNLVAYAGAIVAAPSGYTYAHRHAHPQPHLHAYPQPHRDGNAHVISHALSQRLAQAQAVRACDRSAARGPSSCDAAMRQVATGLQEVKPSPVLNRAGGADLSHRASPSMLAWP